MYYICLLITIKNNKMNKEVIRSKVDFNFDWTYRVKIKKLRQDLDDLEKLGVTEIDIEVDEVYNQSCVTIEAFTNRIETDEEFNTRVNEFNRRQEDVRRRDLEQLEALKLKYG